MLQMFLEQGKIHMSLAGVCKDFENQGSSIQNDQYTDSNDSRDDEWDQVPHKNDSHRHYQAAIIVFQKYLDELRYLRQDLEGNKYSKIDVSKLEK